MSTVKGSVGKVAPRVKKMPKLQPLKAMPKRVSFARKGAMKNKPLGKNWRYVTSGRDPGPQPRGSGSGGGAPPRATGATTTPSDAAEQAADPTTPSGMFCEDFQWCRECRECACSGTGSEGSGSQSSEAQGSKGSVAQGSEGSVAQGSEGCRGSRVSAVR